MHRRWAPLAVLIFTAGILFYSDLQADAAVEGPKDGMTVVEIEIQGNHRIETATIRSRLKIKEGSSLSADRVREDINTLYQLGFFGDVRVDSEPVEGGVKLIYVVAERPYISDIGFVGNVEIMSDKLKEKLSIKATSFLDDVLVKENAEHIRQYYDEEGYYNTIVIPVLKMQGDKVSLTYYIKEGAKATVKKIQFDGNKVYPPMTLLKNIDSKEYYPLTSWFTSSGYYKKEMLNEDVDKLKDYYLNQGYLQVQIGTPQVRFKDDRSQTLVPYPILHGEIDYPYEFHAVRVSIAFSLIEGDQFEVRNITIAGHHVFTTDRLRQVLRLKEGDIFRRNVLRDGVAAIHDLYGEKGYLYAMVIPQYTTDAAGKTVDLTLEITEDNPMQIRQITIAGNDKTRDKVVRRELRLNERELVDTRLLRRSFQRINNLNFFDSVEIVPDRVGSDEVDLHVRVKEKSTGAFSIGGGYSSVDRLVGMTDITQGNLFGRGELLRARAEFGKTRSAYSLTFREPYLLDHPVSGTVDLFNQVRDFNTYIERRIGGDLVLGKSFSEYLNGTLSYTHETLTLFSVQPSAPSLVIDQINQVGNTSTTSSIGVTIARDTRDFYFDPNAGGRTALTVQYAGTFLGGDNNYIKSVLDISRFYPIRWDTVFSLHGRLGFAHGITGTDLPIGERFYVGGINTVRGFDYGEAGPVDPITHEIYGGNKELIINAEYLLPLVPEAKIKAVFFFDVGKGFDDNESLQLNGLRYSSGLGLRWISPIGPLRLEWGYNLHPHEHEPHSTMDFTIGTVF